jgi:GH15 family glucan-1,4-alpha-glucosidase
LTADASLRNDVGLLAEEYDPRARRQLGNFPQVFSHVPLVIAAHLIAEQVQHLGNGSFTDKTRGTCPDRGCPR